MVVVVQMKSSLNAFSICFMFMIFGWQCRAFVSSSYSIFRRQLPHTLDSHDGYSRIKEEVTAIPFGSRPLSLFPNNNMTTRSGPLSLVNNDDAPPSVTNENASPQEDARSAVPSTDNKNNNNNIPTRNRFHHFTICMVPPEQETAVWEQLTAARMMLRDPGLFRWPPHANLLYPFLNPYYPRQPQSLAAAAAASMSEENQHMTGCASDRQTTDSLRQRVDPAVLNALHNACRQCEPFTVSLNRLGTFGGAKRGVLWLYPSSSSSSFSSNIPSSQGGKCTETDEMHDSSNNNNHMEPLIHLQQLLEEQFPDCTDQRKNNGSGTFQPHMTLSHFVNLQAARDAQDKLEQEWGWRNSSSSNQAKDDEKIVCDFNQNNSANITRTAMQFDLKEIYLLSRKGDNGQFIRLVTVELGATGKVHVHDPPACFALMPLEEADWVREERMALKSRRRNKTFGKRRGGRRRNNGTRGPARIPDPPEVIEAKRAARKAKREALQAQQQEFPERKDD